ncbi:carbohydrate deacetylase [Pseudomonas rhizoryzae]|uniref:carbohydrate deacetylase n=1 Tax=Pseudomonas rhizoryzae TaxID=2571129 RepID=UPI0007361BEB|nr:ChbG/HpnK family deacetylase [Pseudomonas rhizoryzae]KTT28973.1 hypothetical protein SB9_22680 [Pseudomonas psychrotolerans]KTT34071.1 hypothetical protein NS201_03535 [Pseudomonas psychrotolerans]KTT76295.1 hypothetical protein SB18R_11510 [Pseudomonas psychrotolerans]
MRYAIVNADDFGLSPEENRIILAAFDRGVISSATLMANMPAFVEACQAIAAHHLQGRIGLHLNLTYGSPLTQALRDCPRFCNHEGQFQLRLPFWLPVLRARERQAVREELAAQWDRCLAHGVTPSHLDSHQHVHNRWALAGLVADFAASHGVPVRQARNLGRNLGPLKRLYKRLINRRLAARAPSSIAFTCTPRDLQDDLLGTRGPVEVIAHPTLLADGDFGDVYIDDDLSLTALLDQRLAGYQRLGYAELGALSP